MRRASSLKKPIMIQIVRSVSTRRFESAAFGVGYQIPHALSRYLLSHHPNVWSISPL